MKCIGLFVFFYSFSFGLCCPDGWLTHASKCYHFSREPETWAGAAQMCHFMKSELVDIEDASENAYLKTQARRQGSNHFWIDLSDVEEEGTWKWMDSGMPLTVDNFVDWAPGQPDNYGEENCGLLYSDEDFKWNDGPCLNTIRYICERDDSPGIVG